MKNNYINKFQRDIYVGDKPQVNNDPYNQEKNFHYVPDNKQTPTQEQSILSIEDKAKVFEEKYCFQVPYDGTNEFYDKEKLKYAKECFISGAKSMLPIIKELGEALKMVKNTANRTWDSIQGEDFAVGVMLGNIETTLDKYKQYL